MVRMRQGDKDGYKEIYDQAGELILHPNERKLVVEENVVPTLKSTWRYYGGEYLLEPSKGSLYLTNERLVFINIPERMFAIGGEEGARAMAAPVKGTFELGDMSKGSAVREYFEIPNIEIMASERKEGAVSTGEMVSVYILSSGNQFHLSMVLSKESDLLARLMNKQVKSLDELVNNLKDYFKQTEWMYTESEKKKLDMQKRPEMKAPEGPRTPTPRTAPPPPKDVPIKDQEVIAPPPATRPPSAYPRPVRDERTERQSLNYFETLYKKGLIKEEIYRKLLEQYKAMGNGKERPEATSAPVSMPRASSVKDLGEKEPPVSNRTLRSGGDDMEVPIPPPPAPAGQEAAQGKPDDEILNMLDQTLTNLSGPKARQGQQGQDK